MSIETNKATARHFHELFDQGNLDGMEAILAPSCRAYQPGVPGPLDLETFKQFGKMFLTAFSGSRTVIEDQIAEGDRVASRGTWSATHTSDFNGIPATGRQFTIPIMVIDRLVDGKIVEHWGQPDMLGLLQQLGVIPAPA